MNMDEDHDHRGGVIHPEAGHETMHPHTDGVEPAEEDEAPLDVPAMSPGARSSRKTKVHGSYFAVPGSTAELR